MSGICASCDEPTESEDESLCPACLATPDEREAQNVVDRALAVKVEIAQLFRAARGAARLARIYMHEAQTVDARARSCLDELASCRRQIHALRGGGPVSVTPSERPGLRKAVPAIVAADRSRATG